jgi:hypothetical protein
MNTATTLTFLATPLSILAGLLLVATAAGLGLAAWRRSGWSPRIGLLEGIRLLTVVMVALALNQPELLQEFRPRDRPVLLVLHDTSRSMQTRDVLDPDQTTAPPRSRRESIQGLLDPARWKPLAPDVDVEFQPFSSTLATPEQATDMNGALAAALRDYPHLRAVVLISDGDWNRGGPPSEAAGRLRVGNTPVLAVGAGSPTRMPDVVLLRCDAPTYGVLGKPVRIPVVIDSALPQDYEVDLLLRDSTGHEVTKQVTIPAMGRLEDAIVWEPEQAGEVQLTVLVPPHADELVEENNAQTVPITIRQEALRVLLIESMPRWEYRYLRNAIERDPGIDVSCLLFHPDLDGLGAGAGYLPGFPETREELSRFDVVFLGDVGVGPGQLTADQCRLLDGLVRNQASGLILMPGLRGGHLSLLETDLETLYPVVLDPAQPAGRGSRWPADLALTESGRRSLLTKLADADAENDAVWESLPGFHWHAPVLRAKAGTEVLATHRTESNRFGRIPLLVTRTYGTGKVLFMGTDGAWRWREGVEDQYHYRFWGQVARWMAYQRNIAQGQWMRIYYSPDRPRAEEPVTLYANVQTRGGEPLQAGDVRVQSVAPSGQATSVQLLPADQQWGLFTGRLTPQESGVYQLRLMCRENDSTLEAKLAVQEGSAEQLGRPARMDVLEEIAALTGGKLVHGTNVADLLPEITQLPEREPQVRRLRLWSHPLLAGAILLLLATFWIGRKLAGLV